MAVLRREIGVLGMKKGGFLIQGHLIEKTIVDV